VISLSLFLLDLPGRIQQALIYYRHFPSFVQSSSHYLLPICGFAFLGLAILFFEMERRKGRGASPQTDAILSLENAPQVYLSYEYSLKEWSKATSFGEADIAHRMSQPVKISNDGKQVAFNVEIESIRHDKFTATFKILPEISPHGGHYYIQPTIYEHDKERPAPWNQAFARMFVGILESPRPVPLKVIASLGFLAKIKTETSTGIQIAPIPEWSTPPEGVVPVVIRYHDASGKKKFIGRCEIRYNRNDCTVKTRHLGIGAVWDN
jgi:hypothetical protein